MNQFATRMLAIGLAGCACAPALAAEDSPFSANVAVTSDYRFRGVSQSAKDPALQGGVDYAHPSGLYLGAWGSTIDFEGFDDDANLEVDLYGGYKWSGAGVDWDVGLLHYAYPGSDSDNDLPFTEIYFGGTYGPVFAKYYYTNDYTGPTDEAAYYLTAGANFELGGGYSLGISLGQSAGDGVDESFGDSYVDYKLGVSKEFAGFGFNLAYVDTDIDPEIEDDVFNSEGTVVLTVSKVF
ncbi:hypothetical protein SVA_0039 [Sulfurifustis variabilis]|uniref:TIGR02001 family outer membrane protein n=1 Tax=Sulfurifustis variabilis TaxID=1675686 RepID=A0A1B4V9Y9_9GAMM|nr:TorF family putative porin [Sulfurifustis variabilis]BAU46621.1 hypothetical protein SVA_0039 [Sulfurifustis variabilis]